jgi:NAD(P)-dependent dehydrogenase (short-subunit alcohol dehydrogenase family)
MLITGLPFRSAALRSDAAQDEGLTRARPVAPVVPLAHILVSTGRFTTPAQIATLITFLASDRAARSTGASYLIGGA